MIHLHCFGFLLQYTEVKQWLWGWSGHVKLYECLRVLVSHSFRSTKEDNDPKLTTKATTLFFWSVAEDQAKGKKPQKQATSECVCSAAWQSTIRQCLFIMCIIDFTQQRFWHQICMCVCGYGLNCTLSNWCGFKQTHEFYFKSNVQGYRPRATKNVLLFCLL